MRILKSFSDEISVQEDSLVDLSSEGGNLIIVPHKVSSGITLKSLLSEVTESNLHGEEDFGPAVGEEAW